MDFGLSESGGGHSTIVSTFFGDEEGDLGTNSLYVAYKWLHRRCTVTCFHRLLPRPPD